MTKIKTNNIKQDITELQIFTLHLTQNKTLQIANIYIPPRDQQHNDDNDIIQCMTYLTSQTNTIITGDINTHSPDWHSPTTDHRGNIIADIIQNSDHIILNTNTHKTIIKCKTTTNITRHHNNYIQSTHKSNMDHSSSIILRSPTHDHHTRHKTNFRLTTSK